MSRGCSHCGRSGHGVDTCSERLEDYYGTPDDPSDAMVARADGGSDLGVECDVEDCDTQIVGLEDGWEFDRGTVCQSCIDYQTRHGHWPDDDAEICVECKIDDGALRHECDDAGALDSVLVDAGEDCPYCGETQRKAMTDGGTKYGDKLPEGGTADLYADDEGDGAAWREETSAVSIEIDVQLHDDGYQTDRKWTVHCTERVEQDTVIAGWGVEQQNKGNYWRPGHRWDDADDFADLPFAVRRRVAAVLNRPLEEITPEHRWVHREDGTGMADEAGDSR